jgi:very-short-patch-repair endonuclease
MGHRLIAKRLRSRARHLRQNETEAERRIWSRLRAHRFGGASIRRQVPIGPYVADFVCFDSRLVVEIDGGQHADSARDRKRDAWLQSQNFRVLRFWNNDGLSNLEGVLEQISQALAAQGTPPSLTLPRKGGGNALRRGES